ncbi:hypothetical protein [Streptomyces sp. NPDC059970]|uniref:hypothetical protein n=1 Tax=Streptomyces sp. NPDC059970 TaxID=3347019 RepID=UPI0036BB6DFF
MQDWWRDQAPTTGVTVRDDMRQEVFRPLPVHLGALDETLTWCGEAAEAANTRIDVELTVQNGTLHVWLGLDKVNVQAVCNIFARLLSHTLPYTDCLVGDDHVLLRLHGEPETIPHHSLAAAGMDAYVSEPLDQRRPTEVTAAPMGAPDEKLHSSARAANRAIGSSCPVAAAHRAAPWWLGQLSFDHYAARLAPINSGHSLGCFSRPAIAVLISDATDGRSQ